MPSGIDSVLILGSKRMTLAEAQQAAAQMTEAIGAKFHVILVDSGE